MGQSSTKRMSNADVNHLRCHTQLSKNEIKNLHKAFMLEYASGEWNRIEFLKFFEDSGVPVNFILLMFKNFDKDKSGKVDFKEYLIAMDKVTNGSDDDKITWFFRIADKDGYGSVDLNECKTAIGADDKTTNKEAKKMFKKLDKDGDKKLTLKEFKIGCEKIEGLKEMVLNQIDLIAETSIWKLKENADKLDTLRAEKKYLNFQIAGEVAETVGFAIGAIATGIVEWDRAIRNDEYY